MLLICFFAGVYIFAISLACSTYNKEKKSCEKGIAIEHEQHEQPQHLQSEIRGEFKRQVKD